MEGEKGGRQKKKKKVTWIRIIYFEGWEEKWKYWKCNEIEC